MTFSCFSSPPKGRARRQAAGFSLAETLVAMLLIGIAFLAAFSAIGFSKTQMYRDKEMGIATGFCVHYLEFIKTLPFDQLTTGTPLNGLFNGSATAAATVQIPTTTNWFTLNNTNYLIFDPELAWLVPRNPELRVTLTSFQLSGVTNLKQICVRMRWDPPFKQGNKLAARMDMVRVKDL